MDNSSVDSIFSYFEEMVKNKQPIDATTWIEGAQRLNVLLQAEQEKLFILEEEMALMRKKILEEGKTATYAKMMIEATSSYTEMKKQKAKIERCIEMIKISKLNARLASELMRNNL